MKKAATAILITLILAGIFFWGYGIRSKVLFTKKVTDFRYSYLPVSRDVYKYKGLLGFAGKVVFSKDGKFVYILSEGKVLRATPDFSGVKEIFDGEKLKEFLCPGGRTFPEINTQANLISGEKGDVCLCLGNAVAASEDYGENWHFTSLDFTMTAGTYVNTKNFDGLVLGGLKEEVNKSYGKAPDEYNIIPVVEFFNPEMQEEKLFKNISTYEAINVEYLYPSVITSDNNGNVFFSLNGDSGYIEFINSGIPKTFSEFAQHGVALLGHRINSMIVSGNILYAGTDSGLYEINLGNLYKKSETGGSKIVQSLIMPKKANFYFENGFNKFWGYARFGKSNPDLNIVKLTCENGAVFAGTGKFGIFETHSELTGNSQDKFYRIGNYIKPSIRYSLPVPADKRSQAYVKNLLKNFDEKGYPANYWLSDLSIGSVFLETTDFDYSARNGGIIVLIKGLGPVIMTRKETNKDWLYPY